MNVAVIPARGGSKRIPLKNIKLFLDRPIIAYSIEVAKASDLFDRIIVSTDNQEIADVAISCGAEVPFLRPEHLADDFSGTHAVVKHALIWLIESGMSAEYACCIYATAPMLQTKYLVEGFERLIGSASPFAFSVTSFEFPVQRAIRINAKGRVEACYPECIQKRSQDLEEAFHDAGQFYWGRADAFIDDVDLYASGSIPIKIPRYLVQDIDTAEDWKRAEMMYALQTSMKMPQPS